MAFLGESAALGTAALWSITSLLFTFAVTRMGSLALNLVRLTLAAAGLLAIALAVEGSGWLTGMRWPDAVFLAASGFVGLTVGDWVYFKALHMIGARQGTLLMALAPAVTVVLAMPVLNERPGPYAILGMALTMTGVLWVVLERPNVPAPAGHRVRGAFFGGLGACCQAGGLILSKLGMRGIVGPLPASAVRMTFGAAGVWLLFLLSRRRPALVRPLQDSRLLAAVIAASILGPIAGILAFSGGGAEHAGRHRGDPHGDRSGARSSPRRLGAEGIGQRPGRGRRSRGGLGSRRALRPKMTRTERNQPFQGGETHGD